MLATINISATISDGGTPRVASSSDTVNVSSITSGAQTIGNTYEAVGTATTFSGAVMLYNAGTVDVSVRLQLDNFDTDEYLFMTLIAGGVLVVNPIVYGDAGPSQVSTIAARTDTGTASIEYCVLT
jgi:hypothetical protein